MDSNEQVYFEHQGLEYKNIIGEGSFGKLFLVYSSHYDQFFALKKVPRLSFNEGEIECLKHICQKNIINLYKYYFFNDHVYLLMEYCPHDLQYFLNQDGLLDENLMRKYMYDMLLAIKTCHDNNIAHQDIKPSNFLVDKYGRIKVCDFGLSGIYDENPSSTILKGTLLYMAPELFRKKEYNPLKADIWSLGVTFFYMATKSYPFYSANKQEFIKIVNTGLFPFYKIAYTPLRQLILRCLDLNPETRASIDELLGMTYFDPIRVNSFQDVKEILKTQSLNKIIHKPFLNKIIRPMERNSVSSFRKKIPIELRKYNF